MDSASTSLLVLAVVVVLFVWNRLPVELVAVGTALALYATGLLSIEEALAGFGDPVVVFIAALFVVSEGLNASGVTTWAGGWVIDKAGDDPRRLLVLAMLMCAALTAVISLNGAVAALLPMVVVLAIRIGVSPSRMLMPLAFAGSAGSLLLLTGTPINVIVSDAAIEAGAAPFGFFEFALVGVPLVIGVLTIVLLLGPRVLPDRTPEAAPRDLSGYASVLLEHYALDGGLFRLRVRGHSPCVGQLRADLEADSYPGVQVLAVSRPGGSAVPVDGAVAADDVLLVRADAVAANRLVLDRLLAVSSRPGPAGVSALLDDEIGVVEVVVPPRSRLLGERMYPGMVRRGDQVILAVQRRGMDRGPGPTELEVGDTLLVQGTWAALEQNVDNPDVLVVDSPDLVRRQVAPLGSRAWRAIGVTLAMVVLLASGAAPAVVGALLAALAMILLRVVNLAQVYRAIPWQTLILVGGLIPLSVAIQRSGAADLLADGLVSVVGDAGPYALLLALFLLTGALGQVVSNTATALIVIPVAVAAAADLDVSVRPVLMMMTVAAAASFLTPIATPANMMVMGPGGYRFGDYWRLGLPIMAWFAVVGILWVPVIWSF